MKNIINKFIIMIFNIILTISLTSNVTLATEQNKLIQPKVVDGIDFENDRKEAEKWAKSTFNKWLDSLGKDELKSLSNLNNPIENDNNFYNINKMLKAFGGNLDNRPLDSDSIALTDRYKNDVENIVKSLSRKNAKLNDNLYVYNEMSLNDFYRFIDEKFIENDGSLNRKKLSDLASFLLYGKSIEFKIVNIAEETTTDSDMMKWRIRVPKGTPVAYIDNNKIALPSEIGLKIKDCNIINIKGKEYLRIDADLVSGKEIDSITKEVENTINKDLKDSLNINNESNLLELNFQSEGTSLATEQLSKIFEEIESQIGNTVLRKVLDFMIQKDGKIILTDFPIAAVPDTYSPKPQTQETLIEYVNAAGVFNYTNRSIVLNITNSFLDDAEISNYDLSHEFGHAIDYLLGELVVPGKNLAMSDSTGFKNVFDKEKDNLTEYAKTNSHEFWAEAFKLMYSKYPGDIEEVKQYAPETYKFITDAVNTLR